VVFGAAERAANLIKDSIGRKSRPGLLRFNCTNSLQN
jgi:hypothetical protein